MKSYIVYIEYISGESITKINILGFWFTTLSVKHILLIKKLNEYKTGK